MTLFPLSTSIVNKPLSLPTKDTVYRKTALLAPPNLSTLKVPFSVTTVLLTQSPEIFSDELIAPENILPESSPPYKL